MRAPCSLPTMHAEPAFDIPGYQPWDRFADDFECFLEEQFDPCAPQQTATPVSEPSTNAAPLEGQISDSTLAKPCGLPRPRPKCGERRKTHNRAAQKQWREKQKVGQCIFTVACGSSS